MRLIKRLFDTSDVLFLIPIMFTVLGYATDYCDWDWLSLGDIASILIWPIVLTIVIIVGLIARRGLKEKLLVIPRKMLVASLLLVSSFFIGSQISELRFRVFFQLNKGDLTALCEELINENISIEDGRGKLHKMGTCMRLKEVSHETKAAWLMIGCSEGGCSGLVYHSGVEIPILEGTSTKYFSKNWLRWNQD